MSELTHKDLHWFRLANSNPDRAFYAFKDRFLRRFATPDGFDLQHMPMICHGCAGSGKWRDNVECNRCDGSGIYDIRDHWLQRWNLAGQIYHKPMDHADVYHLHVYKYPTPITEIEGRIQHTAVDSKVSHRAYFRLLLRWEPGNFYRAVMDLVKWKITAHRAKMYFCLIRLRNKLDLFPSVPETDDVPF